MIIGILPSQFTNIASGCKADDKCLSSTIWLKNNSKKAETQLSKNGKNDDKDAAAVVKTVPQLGCVSPDSEPSELPKSEKYRRNPRQKVLGNSTCTIYATKIKVKIPHQRSPYAMKMTQGLHCSSTWWVRCTLAIGFFWHLRKDAVSCRAKDGSTVQLLDGWLQRVTKLEAAMAADGESDPMLPDPQPTSVFFFYANDKKMNATVNKVHAAHMAVRGKWRQAATTSCNERRSPSEPPAAQRSSMERAKARLAAQANIEHHRWWYAWRTLLQRTRGTDLGSRNPRLPETNGHQSQQPAQRDEPCHMHQRAPGTLTLWLGAPAPERLQHARHTFGGVVHQR